MEKRTRGIIFDMDNTLLRSRIDFGAIKYEVFEFLLSVELLPSEFDITDHTASTLIEKVIHSGTMTDGQKIEMWDIVQKHEVAGMKDADLEPGATELLERLKADYYLTVVTNNAIEAAQFALRENGIYEYFDLVVGRDKMSAMKPSPDGFLYVKEQYRDLTSDEWISVGDAWIDGKASAEAGIRFIAYQSDMELMNKRGVFPFARIHDIRELIEYI